MTLLIVCPRMCRRKLRSISLLVLLSANFERRKHFVFFFFFPSNHYICSHSLSQCLAYDLIFLCRVDLSHLFSPIYHGVRHLKITNKPSLTTHPSLNSCSAVYSHCSISFSFVSLTWFKFNCNCTTFLIVFIYKWHSTPSNRFLLEVCFVLDGDRIHENWFASMPLYYSFSISFVTPSDLNKYDTTVFLYLLITFFPMPSFYLFPDLSHHHV